MAATDVSTLTRAPPAAETEVVEDALTAGAEPCVEVAEMALAVEADVFATGALACAAALALVVELFVVAADVLEVALTLAVGCNTRALVF